MIVSIPDGLTGGDYKASSMLSSHIGSLVRQHVPFQTTKWKEVSDQVKCYVINRVLDDFQLDYDRPEDRITVTSTMNTAYKMHRNRMYQHYLVFNSKEEVRLEEARLEIEEMRARQMEYEELLVKRSEMEQTMQEHQQMMEE
ncbi:hypothetical protein CJ030_MR7G013542 [Morella rubra]|uniref:Uncharacterized protein n=1 Tax=Morella rubra TaxID=262757 RepID=A0A6A1V280_9ROSI|nr:hypothetical protein CJ030_MR7G013542 [Morella rubra]